MNSRDYFLGALTGACFGLIVSFLSPPFSSEPPPADFKVVDHRDGCDIIRYAPPMEGTYHYFLDCRKTPEQ